MHITDSMQVVGGIVHVPQSAGQLVQVSPRLDSHLPLPHTAHTPQSAGHDTQFSVVGSHMPSPQPLHFPQSIGQVKQLSFI
jgi:hypothetical protein